MFISGPDNDRAKSNLAFYQRSLKEIKMQLAGDNPNALQESVGDPFAFKNPRPPHVLGEERDAYEALCRGDFPSVRRWNNLHLLIAI